VAEATLLRTKLEERVKLSEVKFSKLRPSDDEENSRLRRKVQELEE
jgi:hypothetical protein